MEVTKYSDQVVCIRGLTLEQYKELEEHILKLDAEEDGILEPFHTSGGTLHVVTNAESDYATDNLRFIHFPDGSSLLYFHLVHLPDIDPNYYYKETDEQHRNPPDRFLTLAIRIREEIGDFRGYRSL